MLLHQQVLGIGAASRPSSTRLPSRGTAARRSLHRHERAHRSLLSSSPLAALGGNNNYLEAERDMHDQVSQMRGQVEEEVAGLLRELQQRSRSPEAGSSGAAGQPGAIAGEVQAKLRHAITAMQEGLVERDTEVRLMLLAAMSSEHILLIGPPGTAKSEVGRRLNRLISGTYFERLLTRFSVPEELFGPLSMRALEEDKYVRQTRGYLPEAEVAFIDEIFKANSAILNTLLTLVNERLFDNGSARVPVPLLTAVGASNELPESEELDALYDRFLLRRAVRQVSAAGVGQMLSYYTQTSGADGAFTQAAAYSDGSSSGGSSSNGGTGGSGRMIQASMQLSRDDIRRCKAEAVRRVRVPPGVIQLVTDLRSYLQDKMEPAAYVSDRRMVKSLQLLQVAAYCNGRDSVSEYDCLLLQHVLWQRPEQSERIADWVLGQLSVDDGLKQVRYLLSGLFNRACRALGNSDKVAELVGEVDEVRAVLTQRYVQVASSLEGGFPAVLQNLWLSAEESGAVATALQPKLEKTRSAIKEVLHDTVTLATALRSGSDPVTMANLMPRYWADFIRNSDISDVRPLGTTPLAGFSRRP